ncbi:cyclin-dependent kinase G-2 [Pycnococcus provasolii]
MVMPSDVVPPCRRSQSCRSVSCYEILNRIDEGTYGVVYRAREISTAKTVALKRLKLMGGARSASGRDGRAGSSSGFPLTSIRELSILLTLSHPAIVNVREVVVGGGGGDAAENGPGAGAISCSTYVPRSIYVVMEYMDHDLRALMDAMTTPFTVSEVKTVMKQLLAGVSYLHEHWVVHRDLKTSNVLMNHEGQCKICDFGLARNYGSPLKPMTHMVVTLWYRAPELLLGGSDVGPNGETKDKSDSDPRAGTVQTSFYSTGVDLWSMGCIFAELLQKDALFPGKSEIDQIQKIFAVLGKPSSEEWPEYPNFPAARRFDFPGPPCSRLGELFPSSRPVIPGNTESYRPTLSTNGLAMLSGLLTYNPARRLPAAEAATHAWFDEPPRPKDMALMPTYPSSNDGSGLTRAELYQKRKAKASADSAVEQARRQQARLTSQVLL